MVNWAVSVPPEPSPSLFQNKPISDLAQRTASPLATVPQTKPSKGQTQQSWLKKISLRMVGKVRFRAFSQTSTLRPNRFISCQIQSGNWNSYSERGPIHPNALERYTPTACDDTLRLSRGAPCGMR